MRKTIQALRKNPNPAQVARELHLARATVYRHAANMDLKLLREIGGDYEKEKRIVRTLSESIPVAEIARRLGISTQHVYHILHESD